MMEDQKKSVELGEITAAEYTDEAANDGRASADTEASTKDSLPSPDRTESDNGGIDYEELIRNDLELLGKEFPELSDIKSIAELKDPIRYAALRDLGLDPVEAYLASSRRRGTDTRAHLRSAYGKGISPSSVQIPRSTLAEAREIFSGLSDAEIQQLYKKVTR